MICVFVRCSFQRKKGKRFYDVSSGGFFLTKHKNKSDAIVHKTFHMNTSNISI